METRNETAQANNGGKVALLGKSYSRLEKLVGDSWSVVTEYSNLHEINLHPVDGATDEDGAVQITDFVEEGVTFLPGRYFVLYLPTHVEDESATEPRPISFDPRSGMILTPDTGRVGGHYVSFEPWTFTIEGKELNLYGVFNRNNEYFVSLGNLLNSLKIGIHDTEATASGPLIIRNGKLFTESIRGKGKKDAVWKSSSGDSYTVEVGTLKISADETRVLETAIGGSKTLIQLNALATASGYKYAKDKPCRIETTVSDLIRQRGGNVKSGGLARKIKDELLSLSLTSWCFSNEDGDFITVPLAGGSCSVNRGRVSFIFSSEYMGMVLNRTAGRLPLDKALLTTNEKDNPNATALGFKLATHTYLNKVKKNVNTISFSRLVDYANGIPKPSEVEATDRAFTRRIVKPMERDLNHLVEIGFLEWWDYCHENGVPLTDEEQAARFDANGNDTTFPYDLAVKCNIQWQLSEPYPEQMAETLAAREKKHVAAEEAKKANAKKRERIERKKETYIAKKEAQEEMDAK